MRKLLWLAIGMGAAHLKRQADKHNMSTWAYATGLLRGGLARWRGHPSNRAARR